MKSILAGIDSRDMANGLPMTTILLVAVGIGQAGSGEDGCDGWMKGL